ncbi:MAG: MaoC family dehydratase N-terminal domain-containing protein [Nitrospirae bacterium]|nr:MaoC family dehydratase N-terminal domain-containing protein [Nitrospirota bacterium]
MVDKSLIGIEGTPVDFEVEKGAIRRFAEALGDLNPIYLDEAAARKAGFASVVAPPTFATTMNEAAKPLREKLPLDFRRILHGGMEFEYFAPLTAGMTVSCTARLADVYEKSGGSGKMEFYVIEIIGKDSATEKPVFASRSTVIMKEAPKDEAA